MTKNLKLRDGFSRAVVRAARDRAGNICSQPKCRAETVGADPSTEAGVTLIGEAAHIKAASPTGPRYDPKQSQADRCSIRNAIWLCAKCATIIDKNEGRNFSVQMLHEWKSEAEKLSSNKLLFQESTVRPDWLDRMHYAQFINVPRLATMLDSSARVDNLGLDPTKGFRGLGMRTGQISAYIESAVARSSIKAIPLEDLMPPSEEIIGQVISFNGRCYTKNGVDAGTTVDQSLLSRYDPKKSPHFYMKFGKTKVTFPYDPAWVTTSTAYCDFRSGNTRFAGLGVIKRLDNKQEHVFVSPLIVALPRNDFMQAFYGKKQY